MALIGVESAITWRSPVYVCEETYRQRHRSVCWH